MIEQLSNLTSPATTGRSGTFLNFRKTRRFLYYRGRELFFADFSRWPEASDAEELSITGLMFPTDPTMVALLNGICRASGMG
jgi:sugar/nucleoside kinase (ribokinase family)